MIVTFEGVHRFGAPVAVPATQLISNFSAMSDVTTILVVDDEIGSAEILAVLLMEQGYRVLSAVNGTAALELARRSLPDVLLVDYVMPIMNGPDLVRALKAEPAFASTRIILNSGLPEDSIRREFVNYDAFLRKPFRIEALLDVIRALVDPCH